VFHSGPHFDDERDAMVDDEKKKMMITMRLSYCSTSIILWMLF